MVLSWIVPKLGDLTDCEVMLECKVVGVLPLEFPRRMWTFDLEIDMKTNDDTVGFPCFSENYILHGRLDVTGYHPNRHQAPSHVWSLLEDDGDGVLPHVKAVKRVWTEELSYAEKKDVMIWGVSFQIKKIEKGGGAVSS